MSAQAGAQEYETVEGVFSLSVSDGRERTLLDATGEVIMDHVYCVLVFDAPVLAKHPGQANHTNHFHPLTCTLLIVFPDRVW